MSLVLFIDMDAFYASCEEIRRPELMGKPFVVGTSDEANKMKGVVETCSYEAKKLGIHSAMPVMHAYRIKKDLIYVPADHEYYEEVSMKVMGLLRERGLKIEVLSVDEAAIDIGSMGYPGAEELGRSLMGEIAEKVGLRCTIGICNGKILAKMVCDSAKPNGLRVVKAGEVAKFLSDKNVDKIPGVGRKTAERLKEIGIEKIGELAKADPSALLDKIGSFGPELHSIAKGVDDSKVVEAWKVLSVGRERTLENKTGNLEAVNSMLDTLAEEVWNDISSKGLRFKTVTVKARYEDFTERIKGKTYPNYSDSLDLIKNASHALIKELVDKRQFRKVGVKVSTFSEAKGQKKLF